MRDDWMHTRDTGAVALACVLLLLVFQAPPGARNSRGEMAPSDHLGSTDGIVLVQRWEQVKVDGPPVGPLQTAVVEARCTGSKVVTGGGYDSTIDWVVTTGMNVVKSAPSEDGRGWLVRGVNESSRRMQLHVWALCADIGP